MGLRRPRHYDLYELTGPLPEGGRHDEMRACQVLPYVAVPVGTAPPKGIEVVACRPSYLAWRLNVLLGLDFLVERRVDVINLSIGLPGNFDPNEPLQRATRAAVEKGTVVVVAAGNEGPAEASLQELALAPWVISVGATSPDGHLLTSSSRGSPTSIGPTVVADGMSHYKPRFDLVVDFVGKAPGEEPDIKRAFPQEEPGTSFAAPKVARVIAFLRKVLEVGSRLWSICHDQQGKTFQFAVALPILGLADTGIDLDFMPQEYIGPIRRQVREEWIFHADDAERRWCDIFIEHLKEWGISSLAPEVSLETIRRALCLLAHPIAGEAYEVGAGFVSLDLARDCLASFTPSRWLAVFRPDKPIEAFAEPLGHLDVELGPLWNRKRIEDFIDVFATAPRLTVARVI